MDRSPLQQDLDRLAHLTSTLSWAARQELADESDLQWVKRFLRALDIVEGQMHRIRSDAATAKRKLDPPTVYTPPRAHEDPDLPF